MGRPFAGAAATHMVLGLLSIAAGITWICLLYFYEPLFVTEGTKSQPIVNDFPAWVVVLLCAKIFCGFWFFLTGAVGCAIKRNGCSVGVYVALNVLNVIIWVPVLLFIMSGLFTVIYFYNNLLEDQGFNAERLWGHFQQYPWLWIFPAVGAFVGVIEFILSIVSYAIVCCCKPDSLDDGYEYQYEMK